MFLNFLHEHSFLFREKNTIISYKWWGSRLWNLDGNASSSCFPWKHLQAHRHTLTTACSLPRIELGWEEFGWMFALAAGPAVNLQDCGNRCLAFPRVGRIEFRLSVLQSPSCRSMWVRGFGIKTSVQPHREHFSFMGKSFALFALFPPRRNKGMIQLVLALCMGVEVEPIATFLQ